jgi:hypothetical protein
MARNDLGLEERFVPLALSELAPQRIERQRPLLGFRPPVLNERVAHVEEHGAKGHAAIVSAAMLDFEQLAFIEKWRRRASRGVIVALDGTRGEVLLTMRVGEGSPQIDMRGRDATGAVRKSRLTLGDRVTIAIEYRAREHAKGKGRGVSGNLVAPGAKVEGTVVSTGEIVAVDCGSQVLVAGDTLPDVSPGDDVSFVIADEGKAYLIPTR